MTDQSTRLALAQTHRTRPIRTLPNTAAYEWAGGTLRRLLQAGGPVAETWAFFSGPSKPAIIAGTKGGTLTMEQLVTTAPQVLGPDGADPENANQKYFFVKFLDPSDFPPFAYVGFRPEAVDALRAQLGGEDFHRAFLAYVADLLWQDRQWAEATASLAKAQLTSAGAFKRFKAAYKHWAIQGADANWEGTIPARLTEFVRPEQTATLTDALANQQEVRRTLVSLMHRIDFEDNQSILIETPTLHAIAGLSLQIHPKTKGNFHPKDEAWIYKSIYDEQGTRLGWILVEPQRTFDKTESGADFFTPFAWTNQGLGFRKPITKEYLYSFVQIMDTRPRERSHYVRTAKPAELPGATASEQPQWYHTIEEPGWPYFVGRELRFSGVGETSLPLDHHCFQELHVTQGTVEVTLCRGETSETFTINPTSPVFLPASLPYDTISYRAQGPAQLSLFTRQKS